MGGNRVLARSVRYDKCIHKMLEPLEMQDSKAMEQVEVVILVHSIEFAVRLQVGEDSDGGFGEVHKHAEKHKIQKQGCILDIQEGVISREEGRLFILYECDNLSLHFRVILVSIVRPTYNIIHLLFKSIYL